MDSLVFLLMLLLGMSTLGYLLLILVYDFWSLLLDPSSWVFMAMIGSFLWFIGFCGFQTGQLIRANVAGRPLNRFTRQHQLASLIFIGLIIVAGVLFYYLVVLPTMEKMLNIMNNA